MPANLHGAVPTSPDRLSHYRRTQRALALAAEEAAAGHLDDRIEATLAANGWGDVFPDRAALAAAAQTQWWQRLLGRLDAVLDDDLTGIPCAATTAAIQAAWSATVHELPGYLALSASAAGSATVRRGSLRYARLLALFAGEATTNDDPLVAARAGLALVEQLWSVATSAPATSAPATSAVATSAPATSAAATSAAATSAPATSVATATASLLIRPLVRVRRALSLT